MFHNITNYLRGYVTIEVSGFSVERFINLAVNKGIQIWDIRYQESSVQMKVRIKGFKQLKECSKKTGCRVKIMKKTGIPFQLFRHRKRKILLYGILFFTAALYTLASFIWVIEIEGNERILKAELISFCNEQGLKPGAWKSGIGTKELSVELRQRFPDISFAAISVNGTKASIKIKETIVEPEIVDKSTPCDVVAKKTGLIISIATSAGTPVVKQKDVVQEGDVLVSGMLALKEGEEVKKINYVHASAEVYGKLYYQATLSEPVDYREKIPTGKKQKGIAISLMDWHWNIYTPGVRYINYDKVTTEQRLSLGGDFALPAVLIIDDYIEYTPIIKQHTEEELMEILTERLGEKLSAEIDIGAQILDTRTAFEKDNGNLVLNAVITTLERIDSQTALEPEPSDEQQQQSTTDHGTLKNPEA